MHIRSFVYARLMAVCLAFDAFITSAYSAVLGVISTFGFLAEFSAKTSLALDRTRHAVMVELGPVAQPFIAFAKRMQRHPRFSAGAFFEERSIA